MSINSDHFDPIPEEIETGIIDFLTAGPFHSHLGLVMEAIKKDYGRIRLPYQPQLNQPAGLVHGGATASLIDTAVVAAVVSGFEQGKFPKKVVTTDMHIHYMGMAKEKDLICHACVRKRGRKMVFVEADVLDTNKKLVAHGELAYMILQPEGSGGQFNMRQQSA